MKYCNHYLPVPASDYSGAISVLFDMNIICLLYSPGACGSSVSDFDEIRPWSDDVCLYVTKMNELDAVMGMEVEVVNKFVDIVESIDDSIAATAVFGTAVAAISAVSVRNIAKKVEKITGKDSISLPFDGFSIYSCGIYKTLIALGKKFLVPKKYVNNTINIIGYSPLSHGKSFHLDELKMVLEELGIEILYDSTKKSTLSEFKDCTRASCNLIISDNGVGLAEYMKTNFMIPYIMESPVGLVGLANILMQLESILGIAIPELIKTRYKFTPRSFLLEEKVLIIGEPLYVKAVKRCLTEEFGAKNVIGFSFKTGNRKMEILGEKIGVQWIENEQMIHEILDEESIDIVVADPFFKAFLKDKTTFVPIPHIGLSGNLFCDIKYNWVGKKGSSYFEKFLKKE